MRTPHLLRLAAATSITLVALLVPAQTVAAAPVAYGSVLVSGATWAGASASNGDLNVYSNGTGNQDRQGSFGWNYECVELAQRWAYTQFAEQPIWPVAYAYQMWTAAPKLRVPFGQLPNGGAQAPQFGDLIVFNQASSAPFGHVAVVSRVSSTTVTIVEENWNTQNSPTGTATLPISGTTMPARYGVTIQGWLRASTAPTGVGGNGGPGGYTVDGYGGVHPYGSAPPIPQGSTWPGSDIVRGMSLLPGRAVGYTLDAWGGIHPVNGTPAVVGQSAYWPGWDIARSIALQSDGHGGYVLDGWGGLHPFGNALWVPVNSYWPGWDIARAVVLQPNGPGGYVLDGWGGISPFGGAPAVAITAYWPGWDIARAMTINSTGTGGYVLDGYGGLHNWGTAPPPTPPPVAVSGDRARGIAMATDTSGFTVVSDGTVQNWGGAPPVFFDGGFSTPVGRGIAN